ncbi:MAG TPA: TIGR00730 family Rossman fold protein [Hellea balneolensis]|uniref:Cytokinin riboside 5'-monophosphate phosphoribohydrolase n=1 Tax=Hellea balneolensis TaxID=287478 RepID=A0A7V5NY49_9PROT|nr:TIGR00730 family Rossman fold protein [Hellea balneolensis]
MKQSGNKNICVFCGASAKADTHYYELARACGQIIAAQGYGLVYGGGGTGLMGACAGAARDAGGSVLGIIPEFLIARERQLSGIEQIIVKTMRERKQLMLDNSDGFLVLPGGIGTLEEAIEILSWLRLHLHDKPMVFVDGNGYWAPLMQLLHHTIKTGFAPEWLADHFLYEKTPKAALKALEHHWQNPRPKGEIDVRPETDMV